MSLSSSEWQGREPEREPVPLSAIDSILTAQSAVAGAGEAGEERLPMPWIDMPQDQLEAELKRAYYAYYFRPRFIVRTLAKTRSLDELRRYARVGLRMVGSHFFSDVKRDAE